MAIYLPSYVWAYGWLNFLVLCNTGVLLTAIGLVIESPLLVSSQAIAAPIVCAVWALDVGTRIFTGEFLFGGTAYMWDLQYPIFTRMLSLYHLAWPIVLLMALRRLGYDRRGWLLQAGLAAALMTLGRFVDPGLNFNFAFRDPIFGIALEPAPLHLAFVLGVAVCGLYWPTHQILKRRFPTAAPAEDELAEPLPLTQPG